MSYRTKAKNCGNCEYWDDDSVPVQMFRKPHFPCRGSTPSIDVSGQFGARGIFPLMPADGWCANHKPIPPATGVQVVSVTVVD